jgi:transposase InsO family protein
MPWARTDVGEQRVRFVVRAVSGKERMTELCREFGISRPTGYRWRRRFEQSRSVTGVVERSRRPAHSPWQTELEKEERVVSLRQQYGWGAKKIEVLLREQGSSLTVTTINRILKRRGWVGKKDSNAPALQRFERSTPNELWQMDGKGKYRSSDGTCYPLSILDDHSRYAVGLYGLRAFTAEQVYPCLVRTFERYGVPEAMLMDHGTIWWGTSNGYGLTWLSVRLIEQGIRLHYGRVHHPQTQGKVERFHRTLEEAMRHRGKPKWMAEWPEALEEFQQIYNERRPHEALGMNRPVERYRASARAYQADPPEWEISERQHRTAAEPARLSLLAGRELVHM